jgi:hypothetical protein
MRVIIRFSLNNDTGSKLRNVLKPILESKGIRWTGATTGTYEGTRVDELDLRDALRRFWNRVGNYMGPGRVDHFWMYVDSKPPRKRRRLRISN